jgi:membrane protease YdiL (CAAX protease family)
MGMTREGKGIAWFVAIAFAVTWVCVFAIYLLRLPSAASWLSLPGTGESEWSPQLGALSMLGSFGPAIAALVVRKRITREGFSDAGLHPHLGAGWKYYLCALFHPIVIILVAVGVAAGSGIALAYPDGESLKTAVTSSAAFPFFVFIYFGEEFGWRGYLQKRIARGRPLAAALLTGLVWGVWHYPLVLTSMSRASDALALLVYPVQGALISVFYCWLCTRSGSIWPVCLAHSVGNTVAASLVSMLLPNVSLLLSWGVFTMIGYAVLAFVLVLSGRASQVRGSYAIQDVQRFGDGGASALHVIIRGRCSPTQAEGRMGHRCMSGRGMKR